MPLRCGKTTLARLFAKNANAAFKELSATDAGIADLRAVFDEAKGLLSLAGKSVFGLKNATPGLIIHLQKNHRVSGRDTSL